MMISMFIQALYNDGGLHLRRAAERARAHRRLARVSVQNFMTAVSVGTSIGINALVARSLGAR
jgi:hypothetical protein